MTFNACAGDVLGTRGAFKNLYSMHPDKQHKGKLLLIKMCCIVHFPVATTQLSLSMRG